MNGWHFAALMVGSLALPALALSACSSIESNYISRGADGTLKKGFVADGVPITVTVGDRQGFLVTETAYRLTDGSILKTRSIDKTPIPLGRTELFTVDMKRPAVGTASNTISLSSQYPTTIGTNVSDNTLPAVVSAISELIPSGFGEHDLEGTNVPDTAKVIGTTQYLLIYDPQTQTFSRGDAPS